MSALSKKVLLFVLGLLLSLVGQALGEVGRFVLPNGLTVVVSPRPIRPLVACQIWVKAGSADEAPQEAGVAHLLEHMIFKPTEAYPMGVAPLVEGMGGSVNAFTSYDYTVYHFVVPSRGFPEAFRALAHSVLDPLFDPGELEKEKGVVLEEIRMGKDDPQRAFYRRLWKEAFGDSPYGRPVIGTEETVRGLGVEDLRRFHRAHYRPDNMVVVVTGDVGKTEAIALVREAFAGRGGGEGGLKERKFPPRRYVPRVFFQEGGKKPMVLLGFPLKVLEERQKWAFDLLGEVLAGGRTSRLIRTIKEELGLAASIDAHFADLKGGGMLIVEAIPKEGEGAELLGALGRELKKVAAGDLSADELQRAKKAIEASFLYARETSEGEARVLGYFETAFGDARKVEEYLKAVRGFGAREVSDALRLALSSGPTIGIMVQEGEREGMERAARETFSPLRKGKLSNGVRVLFLEDHSLPLVSVTVALEGGQRDEAPERAGLGRLLARCLTRGTEGMSSQEIAKVVEDLGGLLEGFSGRDSLGLSGKVPSDGLDRFLGVISEILRAPSFPEEELQKARAEQLVALKRQREDLTALAFQAFRSELFKGHPYGLNPLGEEETLAAIGREDLLRYWRDHLDPAGMVVALVGDCGWPEVLSLLEEKLGKIKGKGKGPRGRPLLTPRTFSLEVPYGEGEQAHFLMGGLGPPLGSEESYALQVIASALQGQGGRLFKGLREERGLAYEAFFFYSPNLLGGYYGAYGATSPGKLQEALEVVRDILGEVASKGLSPEEVERAKEYLVGRHELSLEGYSALSEQLALYELYGLGAEYVFLYPEKIRRVTLEEIREVAQKYLDPSRLALLVLKPS